MKSPGTPAGNIGRTRIFILAAFALLVLTIVVPPFVNVNRFRHNIVQSISAGLDRPVYANSVELTLFPRPAFVLHHFTVAEWPQFGSEPVITAETVTASLRASTLWHRRVEIASLRFDSPSVNLARDASGQWNFESLISNSQVLHLASTANTGASTSKSPPFPYVEATEARINFKRGVEKLPLSLEGAQLALWKDSGNTWHVRIKARPVRTDLSPADAGQIVAEASVTTTGVLTQSPVQASLEWRRGQLGEISRLLHGEDDGWRGTVDWTAKAQGTLAEARLTSDISVEEFRRAEFVPPSEMDLVAHCSGKYVLADRRMQQLQCDAPLGGGLLRVQSNPDSAASQVKPRESPAPEPPPADEDQPLTVTMKQISAEFFLDVLRHIHPGIAADTRASGEVNGSATCSWRGFDTWRTCAGEWRSTPLTLHLPHVENAVHLSPVLIATPDAASGPTQSSSAKSSLPAAAPKAGMASWQLAPTQASLGGSNSLVLTGALSPSGLTLHMDGPADLRDLSQVARAMNSPVLSGGIRSIRGLAQVAVTLQSNWLPQSNPSVVVEAAPNSASGQSLQPASWFVPSTWNGTIQLHNAAVRLSSFPGSIQLAGGQVNLTDNAIQWNGLNGTYAHIPFDGSVQWEIACPASRPPCARTFTLHTANLNVDRLQGVLRRTIAASGLLEQLNPWAGGSPDLPEMTGTLKAETLSAGKLSLKNIWMQLHLQGHTANLIEVSGSVFGGKLSGVATGADGGTSSEAGNSKSAPVPTTPGASIQSGVGSAHWGDGPPTYTLRVALRNIQPNAVAALWHEKWGRGNATVDIRLKTQGWSGASLAKNAEGSFVVDWHGGSLAASWPVLHPAADDEDSPGSGEPVPRVTRFQRLRAAGRFQDQKLVLNSGQLIFADPPMRGSQASQALTGTVTFSRALDLRLQPADFSMTGTLEMPVIKSGDSKAATHEAQQAR